MKDSFSPHFFHSLFLLISLLILLLAVFGEKGALRVWQLHLESKHLSHKIVDLEQGNESFRKEIIQLRENPLVIEKLAREQLGLVAPNELVFRFQPTKTP